MSAVYNPLPPFLTRLEKIPESRREEVVKRQVDSWALQGQVDCIVELARILLTQPLLSSSSLEARIVSSLPSDHFFPGHQTTALIETIAEDVLIYMCRALVDVECYDAARNVAVISTSLSFRDRLLTFLCSDFERQRVSAEILPLLPLITSGESRQQAIVNFCIGLKRKPPIKASFLINQLIEHIKSSSRSIDEKKKDLTTVFLTLGTEQKFIRRMEQLRHDQTYSVTGRALICQKMIETKRTTPEDLNTLQFWLDQLRPEVRDCLLYSLCSLLIRENQQQDAMAIADRYDKVLTQDGIKSRE